MKSVPARPLLITHIASGDLWAGAEVQLFTLAKTLSGIDGYSVQVILLNHGKLETRLLEQGISVDVLDESQLNSFQILKRLVALLKRIQPDIVHTHRLKENIIGGLAAFAAGNIPSLRTVHGAPEHSPAWGRPHKLFPAILDNLIARFLQRRIIAVSEELSVRLQKKYPGTNIVTIANFVDLEALDPYARTSDLKCQRGQSVHIGMVGRLVQVKRVDVFIRVARWLQSEAVDIKACFHVYGDGPLRKELEELSEVLGVQNTVIFEGHCDPVLAEIAKLDAMLITSDHEGLPMSLLEAMALGIPVIAHGVGGITEVLRDCEYGYVIATQNAQDYARCITDCMENTTGVASMRNRARKRIQDHYSAASGCRKYCTAYTEVASKTAH